MKQQSNTGALVVVGALGALLVLGALVLVGLGALRGVQAPSEPPAPRPSVVQAQDSEEPAKSLKEPAPVEPARIVGRALAQEKPVEGARLSLVWLDDGEAEVEDLAPRTDAQGRFSVEVRPGQARLLVEAEGFALGESPTLKLESGAVREVEVDLTPRGTLVVRVRDELGAPIVGASVTPLGARSWEQAAPHKTDAQGEAALELPEGEAQVLVTAPKRRSARSPVAELQEGQESRVEVVLGALSGLVGVVLGPEGEGMWGAQVLVWPKASPDAPKQKAQTGEGGRFAFDEVEDVVYIAQASHPRCGRSDPVEVRPGAGEVELRLKAGGSIEGVAESQGRPVARYRLVVTSFAPDGEPSARPLGAMTFGPVAVDDERGAFDLRDLAPGRYDLLVDAPGLGEGRVQGVQVAEGEATRGVRVELGGGEDVEGVVLDAATRAPLPGAKVIAQDGQRSSWGLSPSWTQADDEGRFRIRGLAPGRYTLSASTPGYTTRELSGLVLDGRGQETRELALTALEEGAKPRVEFYGVGAVVAKTEGGAVRLNKVLEGSPAAKFGLKEGDEVLRIDGQDTDTMNLGRAVELIRGEEGTEIVLEVRREGEPYPLRLKMERGKVSYEEGKP
jgi:hypothetical protein